jgi:hypothetical protein
MTRLRISIVVLALAVSCSAVGAGTVPSPFINYEGVLRDASDAPLDGTFEMTFRFFDTPGNEILIDTHSAVTVTGGLFNVQLGSGVVTDGSGAGTYGSLPEVFRDFEPVFMEVTITKPVGGTETLSPRIQVTSAAYAMNAHYVKGQDLISDGPLDLYVNNTTGDDNNDGLAPETAKATIMGAVRAIPAVLNGEVNVRIKAGIYNENVVLSQRQRNGAYFLRLLHDTNDPANDPPSVQIEPPAPPCDECLDNGILVMDELVEIQGVTVDGFTEDGVLGSGATSLTVSNCAVLNNDGGVVATDGGYVELQDGCQILNNNAGVGSIDHGTIEINGPVYFCGNSQAAEASKHGSISFQIEPGDICNFCGTDGAMVARQFSIIEGYDLCTNEICSDGPDGRCDP